MAQNRQRLVTVITGYEPRGVDQVWPPIACDIAPPHAQLQATWLGDRISPAAATASLRTATRYRAAEIRSIDLCRLYIEIDAGIVPESSEPSRIGQFRLFVRFPNQQGGRPTLWDGATHADALAIAPQRACDNRPRSGHR